MTDQISRVTFVQSTERKRPVEIHGMRFQFVTIKKERFFGALQRTLNGKKFPITDREKTLLECADRPDLVGGIVQLARALETANADIEWQKVDGYLER